MGKGSSIFAGGILGFRYIDRQTDRQTDRQIDR